MISFKCLLCSCTCFKSEKDGEYICDECNSEFDGDEFEFKDMGKPNLPPDSWKYVVKGVPPREKKDEQ